LLRLPLNGVKELMSRETGSSPDLPIIDSRSNPSWEFFRSHLQAIVIAICACWLLLYTGYKAPHYSIDFLLVYTGAQCLIKGCNPYDTGELEPTVRKSSTEPRASTLVTYL